MFEDTGDYNELDYVIFLTFNLLHALSEIKSCTLNKANAAYLDIYYRVFENIFNLKLKDEMNE